MTDQTSHPAAQAISVRQAKPDDAAGIRTVLLEAARWLDSRGMTMWHDDELDAEAIARDVDDGAFWVAEVDGQIAGVVRFQLSDERFWPDASQDDAVFLHRLAVRRNFAASRVSTALIEWAANRAASLGRKWLRIHCDAARIKLRTFYERQEFRHHSDRRVGPDFISRYERALPPS